MTNEADRWQERLSEYVDGELDSEQTAALETHLEGCAECRRVLGELREVVERAGRLIDMPAAGDLWTGIAERIHAEGSGPAAWPIARRAGRTSSSGRRQPRRVTFSLPQLAAAAVRLVALSAGVAWQAAGGAAARRAELATTAATGQTPAGLLPASRTASNDYEAAIAQLERVLAAGRQRLDTATVRTLDERLAIIDRAIDEAREALAADPSNAYLNRYLAGAIRRKLDLLRRTAALTEL